MEIAEVEAKCQRLSIHNLKSAIQKPFQAETVTGHGAAVPGKTILRLGIYRLEGKPGPCENLGLILIFQLIGRKRSKVGG